MQDSIIVLIFSVCKKELMTWCVVFRNASTIPHTNFETISPSPRYQHCVQVSDTVSWYKLRCCYSSNILHHWKGGRGLIYFCKVDHSRISRKYSRNWVGLNNLCEILQLYYGSASQTLTHLVPIFGHFSMFSSITAKYWK